MPIREDFKTISEKVDALDCIQGYFSLSLFYDDDFQRIKIKLEDYLEELNLLLEQVSPDDTDFSNKVKFLVECLNNTQARFYEFDSYMKKYSHLINSPISLEKLPETLKELQCLYGLVESILRDSQEKAKLLDIVLKMYLSLLISIKEAILMYERSEKFVAQAEGTFEKLEQQAKLEEMQTTNKLRKWFAGGAVVLLIAQLVFVAWCIVGVFRTSLENYQVLILLLAIIAQAYFGPGFIAKYLFQNDGAPLPMSDLLKSIRSTLPSNKE